MPYNRTSIAGIMVSVLASIAVNLGFVPPSCSTKDYKMLYLLLLSTHAVLRRKSEGLLAGNQGNCVQLWPHVYIGLVWFYGNYIINATFKNISVISWRSVLLVEEIGAPGEIPSTCCKSLT